MPTIEMPRQNRGVPDAARPTTDNALLRHWQFRPHGRRLLTSSAEFWFLSVRILVFVMACAEAVAWGYLGYLFGGSSSAHWIGAAFAAAVIFTVVWLIDASLVTLDRSYREHSAVLLGRATASGILGKWSDLCTFGLRIGVLMVSLTITAPFLAQVVFHQDIHKAIDAKATAAIDDARRRLINSYDQTITEQNARIETGRHSLEQEVAGKGLSGKYGMGAAAHAMAADLDKREAERDASMQSKVEALTAFSSLAQDWRDNRDNFAARYNISLPEVSILENSAILEDFSRRPEFRTTQLAIKVFLAIIFCGLLLLKLFEPITVRYYLSEILQGEYDRYLAGTFDVLLPDGERSTSGNFVMSPQRLYDFLVRTWAPARKLEEQQADSRAATQTLRGLETIRVQVDREITALRAARTQAIELATNTNQDLEELDSAIRIVQKDIELYQSRLEPRIAQAMLDDDGHLEYEEKRLSLQNQIRQKLADADLALSNLESQRSSIADRKANAAIELDKIKKKLIEREAELDQVEEKLRKVRRESVEAATRAARAAI